MAFLTTISAKVWAAIAGVVVVAGGVTTALVIHTSGSTPTATVPRPTLTTTFLPIGTGSPSASASASASAAATATGGPTVGVTAPPHLTAIPTLIAHTPVPTPAPRCSEPATKGVDSIYLCVSPNDVYETWDASPNGACHSSSFHTTYSHLVAHINAPSGVAGVRLYFSFTNNSGGGPLEADSSGGTWSTDAGGYTYTDFQGSNAIHGAETITWYAVLTDHSGASVTSNIVTNTVHECEPNIKP